MIARDLKQIEKWGNISMRKIFLCMILGLVLTGCNGKESGENNEVLVESKPMESSVENESVEDVTAQKKTLDDTPYVGEYLDENNDPNLEIAKGEDGKYIVQIGIFRLASFDDGMGELTEEGMYFTATDMAGNPIRGIIIVEKGTARVTFTDSTWEYIENGTSYEYTKASDEPRVWEY